MPHRSITGEILGSLKILKNFSTGAIGRAFQIFETTRQWAYHRAVDQRQGGEAPKGVFLEPPLAVGHERGTPVICNLVAIDLNRRAAGSRRLCDDCHEASQHEPGQHLPPEPVGEH